LEVAGLNVLEYVNTVWPPCTTVIVALVKDTSVIVSVHRRFGQSGAPGIGDVGAAVRTKKSTLPFLISLAGMA
jgi:hypothetical protein